MQDSGNTDKAHVNNVYSLWSSKRDEMQAYLTMKFCKVDQKEGGFFKLPFFKPRQDNTECYTEPSNLWEKQINRMQNNII